MRISERQNVICTTASSLLPVGMRIHIWIKSMDWLRMFVFFCDMSRPSARDPVEIRARLRLKTRIIGKKKTPGNTQVFFLELPAGLEPATCWLRISCSTDWATVAYRNSKMLFERLQETLYYTMKKIATTFFEFMIKYLRYLLQRCNQWEFACKK